MTGRTADRNARVRTCCKSAPLTDLWHVDDGREGVHVVHAQVGDGEGASTHLIRLQLALLGLHANIAFLPLSPFGLLHQQARPFVPHFEVLGFWQPCNHWLEKQASQLRRQPLGRRCHYRSALDTGCDVKALAGSMSALFTHCPLRTQNQSSLYIQRLFASCGKLPVLSLLTQHL